MTLYSIGHSNLALDAFIRRLHAHDIEHLSDVRTYPGSRKWPWFNSEALERELAPEGITYSHHPALGGRRSMRLVTPELEPLVAGWVHPSFKSYAAWTFGAEFRAHVQDLVGGDIRTAFMCSEAVPWRCHRNILATALVPFEPVVHIMSDTQTRPHKPGEWGPDVRYVGKTPTWPEYTLEAAS